MIPAFQRLRQRVRACRGLAPALRVYRGFRRPISWLASRAAARAFERSGEADQVRRWRDSCRGQRCFVIGNGPSLRKQDLRVLRDETTIVTNWFALHEHCLEIRPSHYCICAPEIFGGWRRPVFNPDLLELIRLRAPEATIWLPWPFRDYVQRSGIFSGREVRYLLCSPHLVYFRSVAKTGRMSLDLTGPMYAGGTVVIDFCLPLAAWFGCRQAILLGCDCDYGLDDRDQQRAYFYDTARHTSHSPPLDELRLQWSRDGEVIQAFQVARETFEARGLRIINATAGGRLDVLDRADLEEFLRQRAAGPGRDS